MRAAVDVGNLIVWLPLELLLISRLLRGEWRRFPFIFALVVAEFLMGVADAPRVLAVYLNMPDALNLRADTYVQIEFLDQVLLFAAVLSLIGLAAAHFQSRNLIRAACVGAALVFGAISFWAEYDPHTKTLTWVTFWSRDLSVCTAILDVALWLLLLGRREKDWRLFLLSGALGIQFSGAAIGDSLRSMAVQHHLRWLSFTGGIILISSNLARIYIWARAFRPAVVTARVKEASARVGS